jgi:parallel beta-helix repeat protein
VTSKTIGKRLVLAGCVWLVGAGMLAAAHCLSEGKAGRRDFGGFDQSHGFAIGDLDADGDMDAVVTAQPTVYWTLLNDGNGTLTSQSELDTAQVVSGGLAESVALGDLDGDSDLDLASTISISNKMVVALNDGTGVFGAVRSVSAGRGHFLSFYVTLGDLDGDGDLDTINTEERGVFLLFNDDSGSLSGGKRVRTGSSPRGVAAVDMDGDNDLDLAMANTASPATQGLSIARGSGDGTFGAAENYRTSDTPSFVAAGDLNGDGKPDIVTFQTSNTVSVFLNNDNGTLAAPADIEVSESPFSGTIADMDGDDDLDLVSLSQSQSNVAIFLNDGRGDFPQPPAILAVGEGPRYVHADDFDGNGGTDLATNNFFASSATLLSSRCFHGGGATLRVDRGGGAEFTDIQAAIDAAGDDDTVLVKPGEYVITEPITLGGKIIAVRGESGPQATTIRMSGSAEVVIFSDSVSVLEGFVLTGGRGGVSCVDFSSPTITGCTITGNSGSGVSGYDSSPTLTNCTISGNSRSGVSGYSLSPNLTNCIVWDNAGGSIDTNGSAKPVVSFSCVEGDEVWRGEGNINAAPLFCGWDSQEVLAADQGAFEDALDASRFSLKLSNQSPCLGAGEGGANMGSDTGLCEVPGAPMRRLRLAQGTYQIDGFDLVHKVGIEGAGAGKTVIEGTVLGLRTGSRLADLTVTAGGGVRIASGEAPEIFNSTITESFDSGVVCSDGSSPTLTDCTISGNSTITGNSGAGVSCGYGSSPTLMNCTISGNSGSGVSCDDESSPILTNCTISGNSGAGVSCRGGPSPTLMNCTISGNSGTGVSCRNGSSPTLMNCAISGNSGNGVSCHDESSPILTNCTISGNSTEEGGGVYLSGSSSPVLINCTIARNKARIGGGVYCGQNSSPDLVNCIVWGNDGESFWVDPISSLEVNYSCVEADDVWPGEGNIDLFPRFRRDAIFDFGRFVEVVIGGEVHELPDFVVRALDSRLQSRSPCIDASSLDAAPETDIEGHARPCGAGVDMGAHEWGNCLPRVLRGDCNGDGQVAGAPTDAIFLLSFNFLGGLEPPCLAACDANGDGRVAGQVTDALYLLNYNFLGGPAPPAPFPRCGRTPGTDPLLSCANPPEVCE